MIRTKPWLAGILALAVTAGLAVPAVVHAGADDVSEDLSARVDGILADVISSYEWLHQHPELPNEEAQTAAYMAERLRELGLEVHEGIGGHGLVGILRGEGGERGPVVLYRADMDALPVTEATGVPYASRHEGVMHACGHDVHMATALGTLRLLAEARDQWSGTVLFVGQPAEEIGQGARQMLADDAFMRIVAEVGTPIAALALHTDAGIPAGKVAVSPGYVNANVDSVDIHVRGAGGHGARPHEAIDPVVIGADIIMSLQTIVSRRLPAGEPAVVTVGRFSAGTSHNIIPPDAELLLTVRSYSDETRARLLREIERVAVGVAQAYGAPEPEVTLRDGYTPAGYNDPEWTRRLSRVFARTLGEDKLGYQPASLGGEDFGMFPRTLEVPGVQYRLGAVDPERFAQSGGEGLPGLHSPKFAPAAEPTLRTGVLAMTAALFEALGEREPWWLSRALPAYF
jgi:amidohydrolase